MSAVHPHVFQQPVRHADTRFIGDSTSSSLRTPCGICYFAPNICSSLPRSRIASAGDSTMSNGTSCALATCRKTSARPSRCRCLNNSRPRLPRSSRCQFIRVFTAQRDRVVASYTVLAATGALSPQVLGLRTIRCPTITRCATPEAACAPRRTLTDADAELEIRERSSRKREAAATTHSSGHRRTGVDHRCSAEQPCAAGIASTATFTAPSDQQSVKRPADAQSFRIDWPRSLSLRACSQPIAGMALAGAYWRLVRVPSPFRGLRKDI
jgi:hypothetical protein